MKPLLRLAYLMAIVGLAGCARSEGNSESAPTMADERFGYAAFTQKVVQDHLKDPESAQFAQVIAYRSGKKLTICGLVNARNGFGGYGGPKPFIISDEGMFFEEEATVGRVQQLCQGADSTDVPL